MIILILQFKKERRFLNSISQIFSLYREFGWLKNDIQRITRSPTNTQNDHLVAFVSGGEIKVIWVSGEKVALY